MLQMIANPTQQVEGISNLRGRSDITLTDFTNPSEFLGELCDPRP